MSNRKYILKPGRHQFAPGSHPTHDNENITDAEIEWYLQQYPHISSLLEMQPETDVPATSRKRPRLLKAVRVTPENNQQLNEDLSSAN